MFLRITFFTLALFLSGATYAAGLMPEDDLGDPSGELTAITPSDAKDEPAVVYNHVVLQGLNKVTGHISKIEGPVGAVLNFGTLEIIARRCWKASPEERPENAALLEIRELKPGEGAQKIFLGWMFSSSPALSGLEHPVYDINVLSCEAAADPEKRSDHGKNAEAKESPAAPAQKKNNTHK